LSSFYYIIIDLIKVAKILHGQKFADHLHKHIDPLDIIFVLAKEYNTIVLPGVGFAAPPWSIRVSLANLRTEYYKIIGQNIKNTMLMFYKKYSKSN
jgi:aspartate 4-decarboxylase